MEELFKRFKSYKINVEGKSESSIDQYLYRISDFFEKFAITDAEKVIGVNLDLVKEWLTLLAKKNNSPATRNAKLTAIKEFYKYLKTGEHLKIDDDILLLKCAKVPKREQKYMDGDTAKEFILSITNLRTKAAAAVTFATGARYCELVEMTTEDIENGFATIIGKGNKERTVYFPKWCVEIVRKYMNKKRKHIVERTGVKTNKLFLSDYGNNLSDSHYNDSLKHYAERYGVEWYGTFSSHKLRHSFATDKLDNGFDVATVRDAMGHESIATTNTYAHSKKEKIKTMMMGEEKIWEEEDENDF